MQALLVVSATKPLLASAVQAAIAELKDSIEIAVFVGLHWLPLGVAASSVQGERSSTIQ
jgi:hypothetical protein